MHYPIRTIATMTGVKPVTLRAWETRYGLLDPIRTESGHRLYSDSDIETIQRALALRARGIPIRQVPELLLREANEPETDKNWQRSREAMLAAIGQFEEPELDRIYQKVMGLHPVTAVIENLIEPVLHSLGERWETTASGIAEEHFFSVYISHKLEARFQQQFGRATGPLIVSACLPHETHDLGMSLFCLAAHEANYRVINLGANTPLAQVEIVVQRKRPSAIVLSGLISPDDDMLADLQTMVRNTPIPVCVGGQASLAAQSAIESTGAVALGNKPSLALRKITQILASRGPHRELES